MGSGNREGGIFKAFLGQLVDLFSSEAPPPSGESPAAGAAHSAWASAPAGDPGGLSAGPSPNRFDPITQSVDRDLARFQATDVQEHLSFAPGDRYQLAYINLHAEGQEAVALRAAFFRQVRAAARRQWAVDRIKANCPHGVLPDGLLEFRVPPAGADVDDGDAWNDQIAGATIVTTPFRLSLHGNWVPAPTGASAVDGQPSSLDVRHRGIVLVIDAVKSPCTACLC